MEGTFEGGIHQEIEVKNIKEGLKGQRVFLTTHIIGNLLTTHTHKVMLTGLCSTAADVLT